MSQASNRGITILRGTHYRTHLNNTGGGIDYVLPQAWFNGAVSLSSNARYTSSVFFNETNTLSQAGYTLVDLAIQYQVNPHLSMRLFSNNVTEQEYKTYSFAMPNSSVALSNYGVGREVGLNIKLEW